MGCFVFLLDKLSNKCDFFFHFFFGGGMVINSILCVSSAYPLQFVFQSTTTYSNSNKSIQFGHQLSLDPCSRRAGPRKRRGQVSPQRGNCWPKQGKVGFLNVFLVDIVSLRMKQMSKKVAKRNGFDGEPRVKPRRFADFTIGLSFFLVLECDCSNSSYSKNDLCIIIRSLEWMSHLTYEDRCWIPSRWIDHCGLFLFGGHHQENHGKR